MQVSEKMLGLLAVFLIFINIGVLFILKWSGMELALLNRLFGTSLGWRFVMPLGMSFFTFQNTSYVIDVYKGKIQAERNFFHYLLYASYFPYIVSGPINRYAKMERQFFAGHAFDKERFYQGLLRILWGYLKEMVIADRAAIYVEEVFGHYYMYRGLFILIAVLLFSLQLYMDFSGCMDIVMGISMLFGIEMTENFHAPYAATTTAEFWRRWHISLTSWLRDYIYIPLGGNRKGKMHKYLNVMVVFLFCGRLTGSVCDVTAYVYRMESVDIGRWHAVSGRTGCMGFPDFGCGDSVCRLGFPHEQQAGSAPVVCVAELAVSDGSDSGCCSDMVFVWDLRTGI